MLLSAGCSGKIALSGFVRSEIPRIPKLNSMSVQRDTDFMFCEHTFIMMDLLNKAAKL